MVNLTLAILFWLILFIYIYARFNQTKEGYGQQQN